jgi:aminoglycoside phosphotransferase (APT) family kinase protein
MRYVGLEPDDPAFQLRRLSASAADGVEAGAFRFCWEDVRVPRMHDDEVDVDDAAVRDLLAAQRPDLFAGRSLTRLRTWGTDHVVYRLGDDLAVRVPKIGWAAGQGERESLWLPVLRPQLPVDVPVPVHLGAAGPDVPLPWYVAPWLDGEPATPGSDLDTLAPELADFVTALHRCAVRADAPPALPGQRGGPLAAADESTRAAAARLLALGEPSVDALLGIWAEGVAAPAWSGEGRWVHGDLMEGNLLVRDGRLSGVVDWGGVKLGDPAIDLVAAWTLFDERSRSVFRDRLAFVDEAMWTRARGWAASMVLHALPYYRHANPPMVARARRTTAALLG